MRFYANSEPFRSRAAILDSLSARKNTNLVDDVDILLNVKFRLILFSGCSEEVENMSTIQKPGGHLGFQIGQNTNLVKDIEILLSVQFC